MPEVRRTYDPEFREGAVRIVRETHKPIAQVAEDLGILRVPRSHLRCSSGLLRRCSGEGARSRAR